MNTDCEWYTHIYTCPYTYKHVPYKIFLITQLTHYTSLPEHFAATSFWRASFHSSKACISTHYYTKCLYLCLLCGKSHHVESLEKTAIFQLTAAFNATTCHIRRKQQKGGKREKRENR